MSNPTKPIDLQRIKSRAEAAKGDGWNTGTAFPSDADFAHIEPCSPGVILALVRVVEAAQRRQQAEAARRDAGAGLSKPEPAQTERYEMIRELAESGDALEEALARFQGGSRG